jgi:hypothetical protein
MPALWAPCVDVGAVCAVLDCVCLRVGLWVPYVCDCACVAVRRGTSTHDGTAIAYATLQYMVRIRVASVSMSRMTCPMWPAHVLARACVCVLACSVCAAVCVRA